MVLRKLKDKFSKRSSVDSRPGPLPSAQNVSNPPAEQVDSYGLLFVTKGPSAPNRTEEYPVDIIAIHGLNGDASQTWTHPNGTMWIRDLLPGFLPGCRVYTYGYPTKVFFNTSISGVQEYSRGLLSSVRDIYEESGRSIIFLCHSLGGIVCKQALVIAHEEDVFGRAVSESIIGIVFLGTPHRGSNLANLASVVGNMLNANSTAMRSVIKTRDLKLLTNNSGPLLDLALSVRHRLQNMAVVSFYETEPTPPLNVLVCKGFFIELVGPNIYVVDRASSLLGIPKEEIHPLYANHRNMCRFPEENENCRTVSRAIRRIAAEARDQDLKRASTHSSNMTFNELEKACIMLFSVYDIADYKRLLPKPVKGTCQWVLNHPSFMAWRDRAENALLWLTGHPGCGKTVTSLSLADYLEQHQRPGKPTTVLLYFCDDKINRQKDAIGVLTGLILQNIHRHRSMIHYVKKVYEFQGPSMVQSFSSLWSIFLKIIKDPKSGPIHIILDALDECDKVTRHTLLESIFELITNPDFETGDDKYIKVLLTSRPILGEVYRGNDFPGCQLSVDESQPGYSDDLQVYIHHRVDELSRRRNWTVDMTQFLLRTLCAKVNQTFLWIHTVIESLENTILASTQDLWDIISSIPPDLEAIYKGFVSSISPSHKSVASRFLNLLLASTRPLHLDEINIAFTIRAPQDNAEDVARACQTSIRFTLQGILGPFLRISELTVSLVHQSVKDFFLQYSCSDKEPPTIPTISEVGAASEMAWACIRYLQLEDFSTDVFTLKGTESDSEASEMADESPDATLTGGLWDEEEQALNINILFREPGFVDPETCQALETKYKFYSYAALNWTKHFALCETSAPLELREAAMGLLDTENWNCRNWLQRYWLDPSTGGDSVPTELTPIVIAAYFNLHKTVIDLLQSTDRSDPSLDRALFFACQQGHHQIVATLLYSGADPNAEGPDYDKPLTTAAEHGHIGCIIALAKDRRTDLNGQSGGLGRTALSFACSNGHGNIVKELLKRVECRVDQPDYRGSTPLMSAARGGYVPMVTMLAKRPDVDVNHRDKVGRTALSWAAEYGIDQVVGSLLKLRRVDPNLADENGKSPFSWAAGKGCAETVGILAQSKKVNKASVDKDKRGAISWACAGGHLNSLRALLKHGCPGVDDRDLDDWTPLAWTVQLNRPDIVEALIATGKVDIEGRDGSGATALFWALGYGHLPVVRALLRAGANPRATNNAGKTPEETVASLPNVREEVVDELNSYIEGGVPAGSS